MERLQFETNVAIELALKFAEGKRVPSNFGGDQFMFTTDRGPFYVSEAVGNILHNQIAKLKIQPGEPIEICKREVAKGNGRKSIEWQVAKVGYAPGEQPDGTFIVPNGGTGAAISPAAPAQAGNQPNHNGNSTKPYAPAGIPAPAAKIPMDEAVRDAVHMVREAMRESGEQWSDEARQGLVSTILIGAQREGWITMWRRPAKGVANAA